MGVIGGRTPVMVYNFGEYSLMEYIVAFSYLPQFRRYNVHVKAAPVFLVVYLIYDQIVRISSDFIREHKSVHTLGESVSRYIFCTLFKKSMKQ